jgi:exodeoxyribonuclease V alpha subunit
VRIFKAYGTDAVAVVAKNPYQLPRDIRGIGFLSADTIAQKVGIARDSPLRARAGISYALAEASGKGHCGLPREQLIELATKLLEIPTPVIEAAIDAECASAPLYIRAKGSGAFFPNRGNTIDTRRPTYA